MELSNGKYSSLYLTEQINVFREIEGNRKTLLHKSLITKIEKEFEVEITEQKILPSYYKDASGKQSKHYELNYEDSFQMLVSESITVRKAVIQRLKELEKQVSKKDIIENTKKHLQRFQSNKSKIPNGYFSMIEESIYQVIFPLELDGKDLINECMPDGSLGIGFCNYLKKIGIDTKNFPTYKHSFSDGRVVDAKLYKNELYTQFREFILIWLNGNGKKYFTTNTRLLLNK